MTNAQTAANAINSQDDRSMIPAIRTMNHLGLKATALESGVGAAFEFDDGSVVRSDSARSDAMWYAE